MCKWLAKNWIIFVGSSSRNHPDGRAANGALWLPFISTIDSSPWAIKLEYNQNCASAPTLEFERDEEDFIRFAISGPVPLFPSQNSGVKVRRSSPQIWSSHLIVIPWSAFFTIPFQKLCFLQPIVRNTMARTSSVIPNFYFSEVNGKNLAARSCF